MFPGAPSRLPDRDVCEYCGVRPKNTIRDDKTGDIIVHAYCGRSCRKADAQQKSMRLCGLASCERALPSNHKSPFCNKKHAREAVAVGDAEACSFCTEYPKNAPHEFCSKLCGLLSEEPTARTYACCKTTIMTSADVKPPDSCPMCMLRNMQQFASGNGGGGIKTAPSSPDSGGQAPVPAAAAAAPPPATPRTASFPEIESKPTPPLPRSASSAQFPSSSASKPPLGRAPRRSASSFDRPAPPFPNQPPSGSYGSSLLDAMNAASRPYNRGPPNPTPFSRSTNNRSSPFDMFGTANELGSIPLRPPPPPPGRGFQRR